MAGHGAIAAVSGAIVTTLELVATASRDFGGLHVALVKEEDLGHGQPVGISVALREVTPSTTSLHLPIPVDRALPPVALELRYVVSAWGETPSAQQQLLGWCLRSLHDVPVLSADDLNGVDPSSEVFGPDERVELVWEPIPVTDRRPPPAAALSLFYVARPVLLDSEVLVGGPDA